MNFINTIDKLGDISVFKHLVERTLTEFQDDKIQKVKAYAFAKSKELASINLPNVTYIDTRAFSNCNKLTDIEFLSVTDIQQGFRDCKNLKAVSFPTSPTTGYISFGGCSSLETVNFPKATVLGNACFSDCFSLKKVDFPLVTFVRTSSLSQCKSLTQLILRSETMATLENSNFLNKCCHFLGTVDTTYNPNGLTDGYIYVPRALVNDYKVATNWSVYASQFRALEDYTVDSTITGELDESKI